jgi:membrane associated rhomboid family serine protease
MIFSGEGLARAMDGNVAFEGAAVAAVALAMVFVAVRKRSFVLLAVIAMFAVMALQLIPGALSPPYTRAFPDLAWRFGMLGEPVEYYRLATHIWVHDARVPAHIVGNVFTFVLLGWPLEEKIGWKLSMAVFFVTGVLGAVASAAFVTVTQGGSREWLDASGYGASGAIFGVIGYFAARYPREQVLAPLVVILARVPVTIAAAAALLVQALVLMQVNNPFIGQLPWPSVLAHVVSFVIGVAVTRVPGLRSADSPKERAYHLDLTPLRGLALKPADKMEVEGIIKEDIPEVAQAKLEAFAKRARCPECKGVLALKGRKLASDCGWAVEFERRQAPAAR